MIKIIVFITFVNVFMLLIFIKIINEIKNFKKNFVINLKCYVTIIKQFKSFMMLRLMFIILKTCFCSIFSDIVTESHGGDSGGSGSKHVCIIAVFLLVRLLYLLIHSLDYLFRPIQTLTVLIDLIDLIMMSSLITYCLLNLSLKLIFSH